MSIVLLRSLAQQFIADEKTDYTSKLSASTDQRLNASARSHGQAVFVNGVELLVPSKALSTYSSGARSVFSRAWAEINGNVLEMLDDQVNTVLLTEAARPSFHWCAEVAVILKQIRCAHLIIDTILSFCVMDDVYLAACLLFRLVLPNTAVRQVFANLHSEYHRFVRLPIFLTVSEHKPLYKSAFERFDVFCEDVAVDGATLHFDSKIGRVAFDSHSVEERFAWKKLRQQVTVFTVSRDSFPIVLKQQKPIFALLLSVKVAGDVPKLCESICVDWNGTGYRAIRFAQCFTRQIGQYVWFRLHRDSFSLFDAEPNSNQQPVSFECKEDFDEFVGARNRQYSNSIKLYFRNFSVKWVDCEVTVWAKQMNYFGTNGVVGGWYGQH